MRAANRVGWRLGPWAVGPRARDGAAGRTGPRRRPHTRGRAETAPGSGPAWPRSGGRGGYPERRVSPTDGAGTLWVGGFGRERWGGWVDGIRSLESLRLGVRPRGPR